MKNNNSDVNQEFEKLLKDKMNELSSSVNCFDRISAKAFPEKNPDFSESGFTVCDLENVTGKSRKPLFLKWTAVAVACAVCAVIIPQTPFFDNFIASFGKSPKKVYSKIIDEINAETSRNTYKIYDMPVDDYIRYDKLITPMYSCPFKDCGKDNINVRIFVRTYNDIPTNQIYAVEYVDEYKQSNFLAVADTKAKFTDEDFEYISEAEISSESLEISETVQANFVPAITAESYMTDKFENKVSLASFEYENIFKSDDEKIYYSPLQVIYYGNKIDDYPDKYYYDINNAPDTDGTWKNAVCFDGFSSMPEESESLFVRTPLFDNVESIGDLTAYGYITPDIPDTFTDNTHNDENEINDMNFYYLGLQSFSESAVSTMAVPYDTDVLKTLKMYFSKSGIMLSSDSDASIILTSYNTEFKGIISPSDESYHNLLSENEQAELQEKHKEIEEELRRQQEVQSEEEVRQAIVSSEDYRF